MIEFLGQELDKKTLKLLKKVAKQTFKSVGQKPRKIEVGVTFVYDDEMQELNKKERGIDEQERSRGLGLQDGKRS